MTATPIAESTAKARSAARFGRRSRVVVASGDGADHDLMTRLLCDTPYGAYDAVMAATLEQTLKALQGPHGDQQALSLGFGQPTLAQMQATSPAHVAAVVLDLNLPDAAGAQAVAAVRAAVPEVPVVVCTDLVSPVLASQLVQLGAQDVLHKGSALAAGSSALARSVHFAVERHRAQQRLVYLANYSHVTGLPNRHLFCERLNHALAQGRQEQQQEQQQEQRQEPCGVPSGLSGEASRPLAVLYVDLDGFKAVNDRHGHEAGDRVLGLVAERLRQCVGDRALVGHLSGDEFAMALWQGGATPCCPRELASAVCAALAAPLAIPEGAVRVTASVGLAFAGPKEQAEALLARADGAMYLAKHSGGDGWAQPGARALLTSSCVG